jgi:hypothetical protein
MPKLRCYILAVSIALPATALAETVTVVTRSTGTVTPDSVTLRTLGITPGDDSAQPYELVISTAFDPDQVTHASSGLAVYGSEVDTVIEFRFGTMRYRYTGHAFAQAEIYAAIGGRDGYRQTVDLYSANSPYEGPAIRFSQWSFGPSGSFGDGDPLAPCAFDSTDGAMLINAYPYAPDYWRMADTGGAYAVQVLGAVPEPRAPALLFAGLALLGLWRRHGRTGVNAAAGYRKPAAPPPS